METKLDMILDKALTGLGYELVDVEFSPRSGSLRVFIDRPGGVTVDDCARVSHHLSRLLTVEGIDYRNLEISSPGLDRPLKKPIDYQRFQGEQVQVKLRVSQANSRKATGILRGMIGQEVQIETTQGMLTVALSNIERARLVPHIEWRKQ